MARDLDSVASEITVSVDVKLKRISEQEGKNGWESDQQSTCHSE